MNKQIKRLLFAELSSKRKLAKSLKRDLPVTVGRSNDNCKNYYMLGFVHYDTFYFYTWIESDDYSLHLKETEKYSIDDLKQELDLSESWFERL